MAEKKINCWQYKMCGREPGSPTSMKRGVCPAATEGSLDGIHGGQCAGRACWVVTGSLCGGKVQGSFATKFTACEDCDFYKLVKSEEKHSFKMSAYLLSLTKQRQ